MSETSDQAAWGRLRELLEEPSFYNWWDILELIVDWEPRQELLDQVQPYLMGRLEEHWPEKLLRPAHPLWVGDLEDEDNQTLLQLSNAPGFYFLEHTTYRDSHSGDIGTTVVEELERLDASLTSLLRDHYQRWSDITLCSVSYGCLYNNWVVLDAHIELEFGDPDQPRRFSLDQLRAGDTGEEERGIRRAYCTLDRATLPKIQGAGGRAIRFFDPDDEATGRDPGPWQTVVGYVGKKGLVPHSFSVY